MCPSEAPDHTIPTTDKISGLRYLSGSAISATFCIVWAFWFGEAVTNFAVSQPNAWFGRDFYDLPAALSGTISAFIFLAPLLVVGGICMYFISKLEASNRTLFHQSNLKGLAKARSSLEQSLRSIDQIEREYRFKMDSFNKLQQQIDELSSVKDLNVSELQKKLNAIAHASRGRVWAGRIFAFVLGVASSLVSSYIWETVSRFQ